MSSRPVRVLMQPPVGVVAQGTDPPKIHDLVRLARMLSDATQTSLADFDLAGLTRWAIEGRYPSDVEEATAADLERRSTRRSRRSLLPSTP
jgi:HEPN domain-containing protein